MSRPLPVALAQATPHPIDGSISDFAREVEALVADFPEARFVVFPELHLHGTRTPPRQRTAELEASAEPLNGPRSKVLAQLAGDLNIWLVPGSVCERGENGALYNTALAFSPEGRLAAWYRKIFPWRPYEPYRPGDRFVVFDVPGAGRVGFAICYDVWFPEVARHLAWMGAEVIVNPVMTTTSDRAQELVLARANAIVNQVYVVSVNTAAPTGTGRSLVVDPEGRVRVEAGEAPTVLTDVLDLDDVTRVRRYGTAGLNRMWDQFGPADDPLELPLYGGRIDPARWKPADN
ncbi:carbon-nitrogen hydrolase family protein [Streptosporangium subroseum]|uniref:Predicted amidohydrolase n=1 Tax=Streptosporangium subroseum TaxID=106412 RepID=A0A239EDY9_9ACTN|nr:carbon-nitrogen hydrolase family protein [Streptosporangium subroseum]WSA21360.1 carbon-nitrogen hydrolase family protein [Streptosporangium subroseum]SNS42990.1 Predicted amidohydrolase [Streptosporangium subroseum]